MSVETEFLDTVLALPSNGCKEITNTLSLNEKETLIVNGDQ